MQNEKTSIGILVATAVMLLAALVFVKAPQADASYVTIKDRDYMVSTTPAQAGGDALFICDIRTGILAVFVYDPNTRSLQVRAQGPMSDFFPPR